jgi:hypothetical protein
MIAAPRHELARWLVLALALVGCKGGAPRSCRDNAQCAADQYCAFSPGLCGKGKRPGVCRPRPRTCDGPYQPVCGCDQRVYANACAASSAGVDLAVGGGCPSELRPHEWLACGARYCAARKEYCEIILSDVPDPPTDYTCKPLPSACIPEGDVARTCSCFPAETRCRSFCGYLDSGGVQGFHLTCRL